MMYAQSCELAAWPFRLTPDHRFFFAVPQHEEILESFRSSRSRGKGFRVLTGEIGAGKTMLFRVMRSELQASGARVAEVVTSNVGPDELLAILAIQFGLAQPGDEALDASARLRAFLAECRSKGQRVVAFIDEAQNLPLPSLESLYPLVDLDVGGRPALEIFLLGQPELRKAFDRDSADEAGRRVVWKHHLRPLKEEDTCGFILHRLKAAGWCGRPAFTAKAYRLIHRYSGGAPRRIVVLCNRTLVHAQLENLEEIDGNAVRQVLEDARREGLPIADVIDTDIPTTDEAARQGAQVPNAQVSNAQVPNADGPNIEDQDLADSRPRRRRRSADLLRAVTKATDVAEGAPELPPADLLRAVEKAIGPPPEGCPEPPPAESPGAVEKAAGKRALALDEAIEVSETTPGVSPGGHRRAASIAAEAQGARSTPDAGKTKGLVDSGVPAGPGSESGKGSVALAAVRSGPRLHRAASRHRFRPRSLGLALVAGVCVLVATGPVEHGRSWQDALRDQPPDCVTCSDEREAAAAPSDVETPGGSQVVRGESSGLGEIGQASTSTEVLSRSSDPRDGGKAGTLQQSDGEIGGSASPEDKNAADVAEAQEDRQGGVGSLADEVRAVQPLDEPSRKKPSETKSLQDRADALGVEARGAEASRPDADQRPASREAGHADRDGLQKAAGLDHPAATEMDAELSPSISLIRLVLTRRIVDREPSGTVTSFSAADRQAFAFVRLSNPGPPTEVSFVWYRGNSKRSIVKTDVGTSRAWRTWSSVRLSPGSWRVKILSPDGRLIGEQGFVVEP